MHKAEVLSYKGIQQGVMLSCKNHLSLETLVNKGVQKENKNLVLSCGEPLSVI